MDFNDTPQEAEFRAKCRAWLEANAELKTKKTNSAKNMNVGNKSCLLYTSPSPRDMRRSRMPSSA